MPWEQTLPASLRPGELSGAHSSIPNFSQYFREQNENVSILNITWNTFVDKEIWVSWSLSGPRRLHTVKDDRVAQLVSAGRAVINLVCRGWS